MTIDAIVETSLVVPDKIQREAGIRRGDQVEFTVSGGVISISPKPRSANREYTPAQRRMIDVRLAKSEDDIRHGRVYGPFDSAETMAASIEAAVRKTRPRKKHSRTGR